MYVSSLFSPVHPSVGSDNEMNEWVMVMVSAEERPVLHICSCWHRLVSYINQPIYWARLGPFVIAIAWLCGQSGTSRTLLPVLSLGPGDPNMTPILHQLHWLYVFCSKRPCWCTNVGMVWLRLTCRLTACQPHHTMVGVICTLCCIRTTLCSTHDD